MKIYTRLTNKKYTYSKNGSKLTINGIIIDLNALPEYVNPTEANPHPINPDWYKITDGYKIDIVGIIYVNVEQQFMFINGNLLRFYDVDQNGNISMEELQIIIDHLNMTEVQCIKERKQIMKTYLAGNSKEQWLKKGMAK